MKSIAKIVKKLLNKTGQAFLLSILFVLLPLYAKAEDMNSNIGKLYLSAANNFYKEGKNDQTNVFLEKSLLYDNLLSDPYYIKSLIKKNENSSLIDAINLLKKAVTLRNWDIYSEEQAFLQLGLLYVRTKDYERALSSLYAVKDEYIDNSSFLDAYTLSLVNQGFFDEAKKQLAYAISKYPDNTIFIKRLATIDKIYRDNLIRQVLDVNNVYKYDPAVLIDIVKMTSDNGVKKELLATLENDGMDGQGALALDYFLEMKALDSGVRKQEDVETFSKLGGFSNYKTIKTMDSMIYEPEVKKYFIDKYKSYTGFINDDTNNDGINEKILYLRAGIPEWYSEDTNQDNINDLFIGFQNGTPAFINIADKMLIAYYNFPLLKTVIFFDKDYNYIYNFNNRNVSFNILDLGETYYNPVIIEDVDKMFDSIKKKVKNYRKSEAVSGDNLSVLMQYFKTDRIINFESYDAINSILKRGVMRDEKIITASADMDNDNRFETKELYKDGKLQSINYDGNNDGIYEFKIEDGKKYWDYNNDGIYDAVRWAEGDGISYRGYSIDLDGNFNIFAKYKDNVLVEVGDETKWTPVKYDSQNNIFWVGEKTVPLPSIKDITSGKIITVNGVSVYIIKLGDNYFAEVLE